MKKAIILFSGGIDSVTALYWALNEGYEPIALTFDEFERSQGEIIAVRNIAKKAGVLLKEIPMDFLKQSDDIKKEGFKLDTSKDLPKVYIPHKNLIFYSVAAHYAEIFEAEVIIVGLLSFDFNVFPDNTFEFFDELEQLIKKGTAKGSYKPPKILFPLKDLDKPGVIKLAIKLNVPLELTWSCYEEPDEKGKPCGKCKGCLERAKGFKSIGIKDPF